MLVQEGLEGGRRSRRRGSLSRGLTAEAFDVHGDGREYVLQMGFRLSSVAAVAHAVSVSELVDGALDSGTHRVAGLPVGGLLLGADELTPDSWSPWRPPA